MLLFLLDLDCVSGYRFNGWKSYASYSWFDHVPKGEDISNRDDCWKLAQKNVNNSVGIMWWPGTGTCRAINNYQVLLPWPNSFPDRQNEVKLCILNRVLGKNDAQLLNYLKYFLNSIKNVIYCLVIVTL